MDFGEGTLIVIKTFHQFVRVDIQTTPSSDVLDTSFGILGSFPDGTWIGTDQSTILSDANQFVHDWLVSTSDSIFTQDKHEDDHCAFDVVVSGKSHKRAQQDARHTIRRRLSEISVL